MAEKRSVVSKVVIAIVVIVVLLFVVVKLDVWFTENRAARDLPDPTLPDSTPDTGETE